VKDSRSIRIANAAASSAQIALAKELREAGESDELNWIPHGSGCRRHRTRDPLGHAHRTGWHSITSSVVRLDVLSAENAAELLTRIAPRQAGG
jgi:hypothetical protein